MQILHKQLKVLNTNLKKIRLSKKIKKGYDEIKFENDAKKTNYIFLSIYIFILLCMSIGAYYKIFLIETKIIYFIFLVLLFLHFLFFYIFINSTFYKNSIQIFEDNKKLKEMNQTLLFLATTDKLTSLNNRRGFEEHYEQIWKQCKRLCFPVTILMIDVDNFKRYNDFLGHLEGDKALVYIAKSLAQTLKRDTDYVARYGGEEFITILPFIKKEDAIKIAKEITKNISELQIGYCDGKSFKHITVSVGVSTCTPTDKYERGLLVDTADKALYIAKNTGKNKVIFKSIKDLE